METIYSIVKKPRRLKPDRIEQWYERIANDNALHTETVYMAKAIAIHILQKGVAVYSKELICVCCVLAAKFYEETYYTTTLCAAIDCKNAHVFDLEWKVLDSIDYDLCKYCNKNFNK